MGLRFSNIVCTGVLALGLLDTSTADEIDFARDIRPILSENCFQCHGPDANARQAELRLDTKQGLFGKQDASEDATAAVTPGHPQTSPLIERIASTDEDLRMPPVDSNLSLTPRQIELLRRWVASGADWSGHWSFGKITSPQPVNLSPRIAQFQQHTSATDQQIQQIERWPRGLLDQFVLRRMLSKKMSPSREASPERLIRRVTLDLTGLPPTLDEIDAFLADDSPDAYDKIVDRLLASPRYGERMAWDWLDAARYADSNGFQGDGERTMWPWRDWVVRALNDNMPFDQFTIHQLAGDQLPKPSFDQRLATGFCRNHMINGEGGRIAEENRIEYIFDQIETVGTVWMGMTMQCCRCHDHKFDPLRQTDYYQLFAFFNQTPVDGGGGNPQTPPVMAVPSMLQRTQIKRLTQSITSTTKNVASTEQSLFVKPGGTPESSPNNAAQLPQPIRKTLDTPVEQRSTDQLASLEKQFANSHADYATQLKSLRTQLTQIGNFKKSFPLVMVMQDRTKPRETFLLDKGLYNQPQAKVQAAVPAMFTSLPKQALKTAWHSPAGWSIRHIRSPPESPSIATGKSSSAPDWSRRSTTSVRRESAQVIPCS